MIDTGINLRIRHYIDDIVRRFVDRDDNAYSKIFDVSLYSLIEGSYVYGCHITGFLIVLDSGLKSDKVFIEGEVKKLEDWLAGYGLIKGKVEISLKETNNIELNSVEIGKRIRDKGIVFSKGILVCGVVGVSV